MSDDDVNRDDEDDDDDDDDDIDDDDDDLGTVSQLSGTVEVHTAALDAL